MNDITIIINPLKISGTFIYRVSETLKIEIKNGGFVAIVLRY